MGTSPGCTRIVICAHFDTKYATPGGTDNATGVAVMLTIAEELAKHRLQKEFEFIAFNSEEYTNKGEVAYLEKYKPSDQQIKLAINLDGTGNLIGTTTAAVFGDENFSTKVRSVIDQHSSIIETDPWYESDHSLFLQAGIPTIALSSTSWSDLAHSVMDDFRVIDFDKLQDVSHFCIDLINCV
jgi:Zn-dependent M28 family amino/carboxypeptidase